MDQPQQPAERTAAPLFAGRYEIVAREDHDVEVIDRQPWTRCWACGATSNEAGELFCTQCGASLEGRRYRGELIAGEPRGLALVPSVTNAAARELLPLIWDQVEDSDPAPPAPASTSSPATHSASSGQAGSGTAHAGPEHTALLTLVADSRSAPLAPPLDELHALYVGRGLARLLHLLHSEGLALGAIGPGDVELTAADEPRLRAAPGLHRITDAEPGAVAHDLRALAGLLESLTATPRTTQRLDEDQAAALVNGSALADVLRELRTGAIADAGALAERLDELIVERTQPAPLMARLGALTDTGMVRELDEDSMLTLDLRLAQNAQGRTWGLFIVADGMGGHAAGEVASGLAIRGAVELVMRAYLTPSTETDAPYEEAQLKEIVRNAILQANNYVIREGHARGNDMGTTITMALVAGDRAVIGNVGDSRTYMFRDGALRRISKDHSLVMRLVELGQISEDEIYTHPQRNAVLRSLGDKPDIEVDLFSERLRPGDMLLLCSDGQWEMTHDPEMVDIIKAHDDPQAACAALIAAANAAGGEDNITSVLVRFEKFDA